MNNKINCFHLISIKYYFFFFFVFCAEMHRRAYRVTLKSGNRYKAFFGFEPQSRFFLLINWIIDRIENVSIV